MSTDGEEALRAAVEADMRASAGAALEAAMNAKLTPDEELECKLEAERIMAVWRASPPGTSLADIALGPKRLP